MDEVKQAIPLEDFFPQIACGISIGILRIACATSHTGTIGALIEGQEPGFAICKLGGHPRFVEVNGKIDQETVVQTERKFLGITVTFVLVDGTDIVLPGQLVFQFECHHGDTVDGKHHVDGVGVGSRVTKLTGAAQDVCLVSLGSKGVQIGLRLEEADFQFATHILNAVAQNIQKALIGYGGFQPVIQLVRGTGTVIFGVLCPFLGLGFGDKLAEYIHIDALRNIVLTGMYPIALSILSAELGVATCRRGQKGLNVSLKSLFGFIHDIGPFIIISFLSF